MVRKQLKLGERRWAIGSFFPFPVIFHRLLPMSCWAQVYAKALLGEADHGGSS